MSWHLCDACFVGCCFVEVAHLLRARNNLGEIPVTYTVQKTINPVNQVNNLPRKRNFKK